MRDSIHHDRSARATHDPAGGIGPATIVVGLDDREPAMRALAWAVGLAQRSGARVVGAYVRRSGWSEITFASVELSGIIPVPIRDFLSNEHTVVKPVADAFADLAREGVRAILECPEGSPVDAIVRAAQLHRADMIVMGAPARRTGRSIAAGVMRRASCPVTVIP